MAKRPRDARRPSQVRVHTKFETKRGHLDTALRLARMNGVTMDEQLERLFLAGLRGAGELLDADSLAWLQQRAADVGKSEAEVLRDCVAAARRRIAQTRGV